MKIKKNWTKDKGPDKKERGRDTRTPPPDRSPGSVIFGVLPVLEALRADNRRIDKVLLAEGVREHRLSEIVAACRERSILLNRVSRDSFAQHLDAGANHQGVMAFVASADYVEIDEILDTAGENPLIVVLDGVEDPRNLGAILRTAECGGADGIVIPERRAVGLTDTVAKSSAGAIEYVKVAKVSNINRLIEKLKAKNIWVVGTSSDAETNYSTGIGTGQVHWYLEPKAADFIGSWPKIVTCWLIFQCVEK